MGAASGGEPEAGSSTATLLARGGSRPESSYRVARRDSLKEFSAEEPSEAATEERREWDSRARVLFNGIEVAAAGGGRAGWLDRAG